MDNQYPSWMPEWAKSATGEGISLRLKSAIPLVVLILGLFKFSADPNILTNGADQLGALVTAILALISAGFHFYGWVRANLYKKMALGKFSK